MKVAVAHRCPQDPDKILENDQPTVLVGDLHDKDAEAYLVVAVPVPREALERVLRELGQTPFWHMLESCLLEDNRHAFDQLNDMIKKSKEVPEMPAERRAKMN